MTRRYVQPFRWIRSFATRGNAELARQLAELERATYDALQSVVTIVTDLTGYNLGSGARLFANKVSPYLRFRTLRGTGEVTVAENADGLHIDVSSALTGDNLGAGAEVFAGKVDGVLQFRSFTGSNGMTVTEGATEIDYAYNETDAWLNDTTTGTYTNYNPTGWAELRYVYLGGAGVRTYHGFVRPTEGRALTRTFIVPLGSTAIFYDASGSATAGNRLALNIITPGGQLYIQGPKEVTFGYDETNERWTFFADAGRSANGLISSSATGTLNDWNPTSWQEARFIDLSGAAPVFSGFTRPLGEAHRVKTFLIRTGNVATFQQANTGSAAGNRLSMYWATDTTIAGPATVTWEYQDPNQQWQMIVPNTQPVKSQVTITLAAASGHTALDWYRFTGLSCPYAVVGRAVALSPTTAHQVSTAGGVSNLWSALGSCLTAGQLDVTVYGNCTCNSNDWVMDVSQ